MQRFTRLLLLIVSCFFITGINAQFSRGTRMAGASVASMVFNSGTSEQSVSLIGNRTAKVTGYSVNITPSLGWFVSENTAVGFTLNLNPYGEKIKFEANGSTYQQDKANTLSVGLGGFARNYFGSSGSVLPFGQFSFDAGISDRKTEGFFYGGSSPDIYKTTYDGKSSGGFFANLFLTGGITKMVGEYTGLDLYIGYNFAYNKYTMTNATTRDEGVDGTIDETGSSKTETKFTNHRFLLGIGFQVFLEKRRKK